jgi:membrane protein DedA with SNARE-associated domain
MRLAPFAVYTAIGSAAWSFALCGVGYGLGSSYERFNHGFKYAEYAIVAGVVLAIAYLIVRTAKAAKVSRSDNSPR